MDIKKAIIATKRETIELRRDFHRHPEVGMQEIRTGEKVAAYLKDCGLDVSRLNKTGVCALLEGNHPGPTLLIRADMDALPVQEEVDTPYKSINDGVMHACGHDAHTAMLMVTAKILSEMRRDVKGNIKFVFEPNEENVGALAMIEEGLMDNPRVDACLGLHVWNQLSTGKVGITAGPVMAGLSHFDINIKGKGGHTATPHNAIDPILAAAAVIQGVQAVQTREIDALKEPTIIMFGKIRGGTASNVIPDLVTISGTLRHLYEGSDQSSDSPKVKMERMITGICAAHGAEFQLDFPFGHPTLVNNREMCALMNKVAKSMHDPSLEVVSFVTLAGEDFSEFASRAPSVFCFLGAGKAGSRNYPHHHSRFAIDEDALQAGVELLVIGAHKFFESTDQFSFLKQPGC